MTETTASADASTSWLGRATRHRCAAAAAHLVMTAGVLAGICTLAAYLWYPAPYFAASGVWRAMLMLIGVGLVIGPLPTLVVFKPGKWGLTFDLWVIGSIQLAVLAFGTFTLYRERPQYLVFAVDRFHLLAGPDVVTTGELADAQLLAAQRIGARPARGPLVVAALRPKDPAAAQRLLVETVFQQGPDIERRPEFWAPYAATVGDVRAHAHPLPIPGESTEATRASIEQTLARLGRPRAELGYLPLIGRNHDFAMIVDLRDGSPLSTIDMDPWAPVTAAAQPR